MTETVKLIHCTPEAEKLIVKMARVSNPSNQDNWDTGPKLLEYLIKHRHWSPFEMASMCVEIHTERDIAAQILRHRSFSFQEFSTRYARTSAAEIPRFRRQDTKNRQASHDDLLPQLQNEMELKAADLISKGYRLYWELLEQGVAKETARRILPLCTPTMMYMHGTLRSWLHYIDVRTDPGTQQEHRLIAEKCKQIFTAEFPVIAEAAFNEMR
jgi:thymidylate synthase (FAD)